ncbi:hypothetical protein BDB01DRAFT_738685 [Pilobolus umbonatus]|nr:hypothetical protein BDB01DRAFT_738685 [Pilobolus umbonatus]
MRISRVSIKVLPPLPSNLGIVIHHLTEDNEDQIEIWSQQLKEWNYPRSDLFHFIPLLNRFDQILQNICEAYNLTHYIQSTPFDISTKNKLLSILNISKLLFDNCNNRNLYNSYEHLNHLLGTTDMDVLEALLQLMIKPAQRINDPKAIPSNFAVPHDIITELARAGPISTLTTNHTSQNTTVSFTFYREGLEEGSHIVHIQIEPNVVSDMDLFWNTIHQYDIPKEYHFKLLHKIRILNNTNELHKRNQLLIIRLCAIVIMTHTMSETTVQNKVYIYQPHLINQLVQLISYDNHIDITIQTYALYALEGIARHRSKILEVLTAFNASANHGILLHILRQLSLNTQYYTSEFIQAIKTLISYLLQTTTGAQTLISAGIMPTLIHILGNTDHRDDNHTKVLINVLGFLNTAISNLDSALPLFSNANGVDTLLRQIKYQVDVCIESFEDTQTIAHCSLSLVKSMFKFLMKMMLSSYSVDALHNLIESNIPYSIKKIMERPDVFPEHIFLLVTNVVTSFIHNEPTCSSVLQEIGVPQAFLKTFMQYKHCSYEVLLSALECFGAICLNSNGLKMFNEVNPLPHFFSLMVTHEFLANSNDIGGATILGTAMDEFIRHHPKIKQEVFICANKMLMSVIQVGGSEEGKPADNCHQLATRKISPQDSKERPEYMLLNLIDMVSRFLDGFLRNSNTVKEFVRLKGAELLLRYYRLPMLPYDFCMTSAFDSLGFVFKIMAGVADLRIARIIVEQVKACADILMAKDSKESWILKYIDVNDENKSLLDEGNAMYRQLSIQFGYIGLLSTVFSSAILTNSRQSTQLLNWLVSKDNDVISLLGKIYRNMIWQNILLRENVPAEWYHSRDSENQAENMIDMNDPRVINVKRWKILLGEVPPALMPVFQGIIKASLSRRGDSKKNLKARAETVSYDISLILMENLTWVPENMGSCKYEYYAAIFSVMSILLLDDRSGTALKTPIIVAFDNIGGVKELVFTVLCQLWMEMEKHNCAAEHDPVTYNQLNTCIELTLTIVHQIVSADLFLKSPHTAIIADPSFFDPEVSTTKPINPRHWIDSMHLKISPLHLFLKSPGIVKLSKHVLNSFLVCMTEILNLGEEGSGETSTTLHREDFSHENTAESYHPNLPLGHSSDENSVVDQDEIGILVNMGFDRGLASRAMHELPNIFFAIDCLFTRQLISRSIHSGPPVLEVPENISPPNILLGDDEFQACLRILVNMWFDQTLAANSLRETNNLRRTIDDLNSQGMYARRIPFVTEPTGHSGTMEEDETIDEDEYEDIESPMDTDEDAEGKSNEEEDAKDKSNEEEDAYLEKKKILEETRREIRKQVPTILARIIEERNDLDFEIRDLMVVLCSSDIQEITKNTQETMRSFFEYPTEDESEDQRDIFTASINKIRIFALMLREPPMQEVMSFLIKTMSGIIDYFRFLEIIVNHPDFTDSKWLTTLFLILEVGLAKADEPRLNPNMFDNIENVDDADDIVESITTRPSVYENRPKLLHYCVEVLKMESLTKDNLISTLRVIVRLTKDHNMACAFYEMNGLNIVLDRVKRKLENIKIQQAYIIMILRHFVEDSKTLEICMRENLILYFKSLPKNSVVISTFLEQNSYLILRDFVMFLKVCSHYCEINDVQGEKTLRYIGDEMVQNESEKETLQKRQETLETIRSCFTFDPHYSENITPAIDGSRNIQCSKLTVHFLMEEIKKAVVTDVGTHIDIAYVGFLLQCLLEMVCSYRSCKYCIVEFDAADVNNSEDENRSTSIHHFDDDKQITGCFLYMLINKVLTCNFITPTNDLERMKQCLSMCVSSLIIAMCYDTKLLQAEIGDIGQQEYKIEYVRLYILDVILYSFRDAEEDAHSSLSSQYFKYFAFAELCHHILNANHKSFIPSSLNAIKTETIQEIAELMLKRDFTNTLVNAIKMVDLNNPQAKFIINALLRPLEQLTKWSNQIDTSIELNDYYKNCFPENADLEEHEDLELEEDDYIADNIDDEEENAEEEVSSLFRNSSLFPIMNGSISHEADSDDNMERYSSANEDFSADDIVEFDSSETGDYETIDESDENSMDTTDEDSSDDDQDSDDDSVSDLTSSSYYSSSSDTESFDSDRSDSIHSAESRNIAWPLGEFHSDRRHREQSNGNQHRRVSFYNERSSNGERRNHSSGEDNEENHSNDNAHNELQMEDPHNMRSNIRGFVQNIAGNSNNSSRRDNVILHPLLLGTDSESNRDNALSERSEGILNGNSTHVQAYEDVIGGSAVRILENLLVQNNSTSTNDTSGYITGRESDTDITNAGDEAREIKDALHLLQAFHPVQSVDRWTQEAQMVYIPPVAVSISSSVKQPLLFILKKKGLSFKLAKAKTTVTLPLISRNNSPQAASSSEERQEPSCDSNPGHSVPSIISIGGEDFDVSDLGIDIDYLLSLPEKIRLEVLAQYLIHRHISTTEKEGDLLPSDYVGSLPLSLRIEVLHQQVTNSIERQRIHFPDLHRSQRLNSGNTDGAVTPTLDAESLNAAITEFLTSSTRNHPFWRTVPRATDNTNNQPKDNTPSRDKEKQKRKDSARIIDNAELLVLFRLLFIPQSISKALLARILVNLCENSTTRNNFQSLVISILQTGSSDLKQIDRCLASTSPYAKNAISYFAKADLNGNVVELDWSEEANSSNTEPKEDLLFVVTQPNLIAQRCLDTLHHMIHSNTNCIGYYFREHDKLNCLKTLFPSPEHAKAEAASNYPIMILIELLYHPEIICSTSLMEQLMALLSHICRFIPSLFKTHEAKKERIRENGEGESSNKRKYENDDNTERKNQPITVPDMYLRKIVQILTNDDCSSHTFKYTLSILCYLSVLDDAIHIIIAELFSSAKETSGKIVKDLQDLLQISNDPADIANSNDTIVNSMLEFLPSYQAGFSHSQELDGPLSLKFSIATAHQNRLLRILKSIDYLFTSKRAQTINKRNISNKSGDTIKQIFSELDLSALWQLLSSCLSSMSKKEYLLELSTNFLPLVECFMTVSKYLMASKTNHKPFDTATKNTEIKTDEEFFNEFTEEHKKVLNIMVRNIPSLMCGSFSLLVNNPKILEFDNKRHYFLQQLHRKKDSKEHYSALELNVRRAFVFEDTYQQMQGVTGEEIKDGKLIVHFENEEGEDAGGVSREWFSVLARQMFDPNYGLFITSAADKLTYQPNRASGVNSEHLNYFKFVGRVIGKAIYDGRLLDAYFTRSFYKLLLNRSVDYRDVEAVDPAYYRSLEWLLENDLTDIIDLTFSVETDDFGTTKIVDLKPDGRNIPVTEANKQEYVSLVTEHRLVLTIKDQVNAFKQGFYEIIPDQLIQIFNEQELELLISGLPDIDIDEWKANTVYEGYTLSSPQIQWFWRAVRSFDHEERAKLLQFSTGTSKVPLEGFGQLQGSNGVQKFQIHKEFGDTNRLPSAHTCFNQIDLPQYSCYEDLRSCLFKAISECSTGFAFV